jgi:hypothetical protein
MSREKKSRAAPAPVPAAEWKPMPSELVIVAFHLAQRREPECSIPLLFPEADKLLRAAKLYQENPISVLEPALDEATLPQLKEITAEMCPRAGFLAIIDRIERISGTKVTEQKIRAWLKVDPRDPDIAEGHIRRMWDTAGNTDEILNVLQASQLPHNWADFLADRFCVWQKREGAKRTAKAREALADDRAHTQAKKATRHLRQRRAR